MDITAISQLVNELQGNTNVKEKKQQGGACKFDGVLNQKVVDSSSEIHELKSILSDISSSSDDTTKLKSKKSLSNDESLNILNLLQMLLSNSFTKSSEVNESDNQASGNDQSQIEPNSSLKNELNVLVQIINQIGSTNQDPGKINTLDNSTVNVVDELLKLLQNKLTTTDNITSATDDNVVSPDKINSNDNYKKSNLEEVLKLLGNIYNSGVASGNDIDQTKVSDILNKLNNDSKINPDESISLTALGNTDDSLLSKELLDLIDKIANSNNDVSTASNVNVENSNILQVSTVNKPSVLLGIVNEISKKLNHNLETKSDKDDANDNVVNVTDSAKNESSSKHLETDIQKIISDIKQGAKGIIVNDNVDYKSSESSSDKDDKFLVSLVKDAPNDKTASEGSFSMNVLLNKDNITTTASEKIMLTKQNIASDIVKTVKYMENTNLKDLTVKIMPKELGEVVIKLTMERGEMKANIIAANKDAFNLINSNLQQINEKITSSNMNIQSFSVNVFNGESSFMHGQGQGQNQGNKERKNANGIEVEDDNLYLDEDELNKVNALA